MGTIYGHECPAVYLFVKPEFNFQQAVPIRTNVSNRPKLTEVCQGVPRAFSAWSVCFIVIDKVPCGVWVKRITQDSTLHNLHSAIVAEVRRNVMDSLHIAD